MLGGTLLTSNMTAKTLKVSVLQGQITWHNSADNLEYFSEQVSELEKETQLIVLPEMWSSGYTMQAHKFFEDSTAAVELMQLWAMAKQATVVGSLIVKEANQYYNRLYVVNSEGVAATYDKRHLFGFAGEDRIYTAGNRQLIYDLEGWRISMNVCYDLRFPVWARNTDSYDLLLYVANWPDQRISAWNTLLRARAIENQAYVIGANCYGKDAWDNEYSGHSAILSPLGEDIQTLTGKAGWLSAELSKQNIDEMRAKYPFLKDRDKFELKIDE